ncbi:diacylglycerol kinase family protein [Aureimonas leprariae]|uniref:diacylglycerol kinase family protein n=1 Tax=Plantimonas leprariae TaxID=2615207 RepID=UPI0013866AE3|nr:diacylglycerol kinase family protein [Aureimonas leprariae]
MLLGIVRNPRSRRNRDRPAIDAGRLGSDTLLREPRSHAELDAVLAEFAARGVGLLAVDGGDGTVRDVLSAARGSFATLPPMAFLASGKTNILAGTSGNWGTGQSGLERLAGATAAGLPPTLPRRPVSTLEVVSGDRRLTGFVLGAGAYARAIALADHGLADRISFGPARVAAGIGRGIMALAKGEERARWLAGAPMRLALDGGASAEPSRPRLIFLATTLRRFTLGVWPFWDGETRHPLRFLAVDAPPQRLAAALLPALRGRPAPWMREAGYRSGSAARIVLQLRERFVLDGEAYDPGEGGLVSIAAGPAVEFVSP